MKYTYEQGGQILKGAGDNLPDEEFETLVDRLRGELDGLPDVVDADLTVSLADGAIVFAFDLEALTPEEAMAKGSALVRTALHAAEVWTPDYEQAAESYQIVEETWRLTQNRDLLDA